MRFVPGSAPHFGVRPKALGEMSGWSIPPALQPGSATGSHNVVANDEDPLGAAAALLSFSPSIAELTFVRDPELFAQLLHAGVGMEDERG